MVKLRIKEILKQRNITSKSLAETLGKSPQYTNDVINGGRGLSIKSLEMIAKALEVPISSLFEDYSNSDEASGRIVCPHCGRELKISIDAE